MTITFNTGRRPGRATLAAYAREYLAIRELERTAADEHHAFIANESFLRVHHPERAADWPTYSGRVEAMIQRAEALAAARSRKLNALRAFGVDPMDLVGKEA